MLPYDPVPWLLRQDGLPAVRARRKLQFRQHEDIVTIDRLIDHLTATQKVDGSFNNSLFKTAGILNCLDDLQTASANDIIIAGVSYLFSVLLAQPGYLSALNVVPGSLDTPCELCGFFGPYDARNEPAVVAQGALEMNYYRVYEPLMGPQSPVRTTPRSSYDRVGPSSCYAWGLMPLSYTIETLCRAGYSDDARLRPAVNALLGAQRESGGWCRNLGGHPVCTHHVIRALGAHPDLRHSDSAGRVLHFIRGKFKGKTVFTGLQALSNFDLPIVRDIIRDELGKLAPRQRKNGTFGTPHSVERVAAVLAACRTLA